MGEGRPGKNILFFGPGAGIRMINGATSVSSSIGGSGFTVRDARPTRSLSPSDFSGDITQTGDNSPLHNIGWDDTPLITRGRGYMFQQERVIVDGRNWRMYGGVYGAPFDTTDAVIWNSTWLDNQFTRCAIGRIIGCNKDSTGTISTNNTIHHNMWAGDVLIGIHGGEFHDAVEHNEGPWGRVVYGATSSSVCFTLTGSYMFNNGMGPEASEQLAGERSSAALRRYDEPGHTPPAARTVVRYAKPERTVKIVEVSTRQS